MWIDIFTHDHNTFKLNENNHLKLDGPVQTWFLGVWTVKRRCASSVCPQAFLILQTVSVQSDMTPHRDRCTQSSCCADYILSAGQKDKDNVQLFHNNADPLR